MHLTNILFASILVVHSIPSTVGFTASLERRISTCRSLAEILAETEADLLPSIREAIEESGDESAIPSWIEAVELVSSKTGLSPDSSEMALAKANGWRAWVKVTSKFAKKYMKTYIPEKDKLEEALDWSLAGPLELSEHQLAQAIVATPEVYLMDPETKYEKARSVAPSTVQDSAKFVELAKNDPSLLSLTYNCVDSGCASECGNCWVSYENRKAIN